MHCAWGVHPPAAQSERVDLKNLSSAGNFRKMSAVRCAPIIYNLGHHT